MKPKNDAQRMYYARQTLSLSTLEMGRAIGYSGNRKNVKNQVSAIERGRKDVSRNVAERINKLLEDAGHKPMLFGVEHTDA